VILRNTAVALAAGTNQSDATEEASRALIAAGFQKVDYVEARESLTLAPWRRDREGRLLAAAWLGKTRLIDNVEVPSS
jgi:pantoate--beta-alanine ligase